MNAALTIAAKDLRLLLRDPRAAVILLLMPVVLILVFGLSIGEAFGRKPDDRIRITVVNLDSATPHDASGFPPKRWSEIVLDDLSGTADIKIELIETREEAERMVRRGERSAIIVFEPDFGDKVHRCSFVGEPFNMATTSTRSTATASTFKKSASPFSRTRSNPSRPRSSSNWPRSRSYASWSRG